MREFDLLQPKTLTAAPKAIAPNDPDTNLKKAARVAAHECASIDDLRVSAERRRRTIAVFVRHLLAQARSQTS